MATVHLEYELSRTSRLGNREVNQDRLAVLERDGILLLVLGDGLGGKEGGELAAETLVKIAGERFEHAALPVARPEQFLFVTLKLAHAAVVKLGRRSDPPIHPATTAVLCLVQNGTAWWAHAGDSRFYLFRNGLSLYRTSDHSYVEELYQQGQLSLENRQDHPMRSYLTQCIGQTKKEPELTVSHGVKLQEDDVLLLCSDGLWEPLDDAQLGAVLSERPLKDSLDKLAERAEQNAYPHSDNVSAIALRVVRLRSRGEPAPAAKAPPRPRPADSLDRAIDEIERALDEYGHEMDEAGGSGPGR